MKFIEFKYRYHSRDEKALVLDRVAHQTKSELEALIEKMRSAKLHTVNLTDNDLVKDHSTHLTASRSNLHNELLCRFTFPEKAGSLSKTIDAFSPRWNISLVHYRAQVPF
ncbi:threonine dehydratase 1 biosynthetic, chloroplastic-like [Solanum lycopersicum]|uniref:threonine dehydratase 1 biosynthetic, chloroplastic-like n=1 Tax=Solanum lycopersicum TaxID=4081 RepID=UPI003748A21F